MRGASLKQSLLLRYRVEFQSISDNLPTYSQICRIFWRVTPLISLPIMALFIALKYFESRFLDL